MQCSSLLVMFNANDKDCHWVLGVILQAIRLDPKAPLPHLGTAQVYLATGGDPTNAVSELELVLKALPGGIGGRAVTCLMVHCHLKLASLHPWVYLVMPDDVLTSIQGGVRPIWPTVRLGLQLKSTACTL